MNGRKELSPEPARPENLAALTRLIADRANNPSAHATKVCFWLGAGADISSGGLSFSDLKREAIAEFSDVPIFDITLPEEIDIRFDNLFAMLPHDERALLVEFIFRRTQRLAPSDAYKLLVLLAEAGAIDAIVTTNFDTMLEQAERQLERDVFQVFAPGIARPYLLNGARFELPKKPYLKLHGDLASRSVVELTQAEIDDARYDASMLDLLRTVLKTHDLVIVGYSGFDSALARLVAQILSRGPTKIFWCGPRDPSPSSPLYSAIRDRVRVVNAGFDDLMVQVGRPVLERPSLVSLKPTYLRCLFEWRVDYCNREYIRTYGERRGKSVVDLFARRPSMEARLTSFMLPNRPLAVVAGASGYGKSTLGVRLHKMWGADQSTRVLLTRSRTLPPDGDLEQHLCEQLGGLGSKGPFSMFQLERWLASNGLRLVVFLDGINEFSPDLERCVQLFRSILRFCYFLSEADSSLRIITTVRQETWNAMLPHLDSTQLRKALWTEGQEETPGTIACGPFTDEELQDAMTRLRDNGYASIDPARLTPVALSQLRDPYLLNVIVEAAHQGQPAIPSAGVYQRAFEAKLRERGSFIDSGTLKNVVARVALGCLNSQQDRFRESDVCPAQLRGDVIRLMKDLHVFVGAGSGFLQFDHDRTFEYFLALGFASGVGPRLDTVGDLRGFLRTFKGQPKPLAAARLYFHLAPLDRFQVISGALQLMDSRDGRYGSSDRELLFGFAREVLVEMAEQGQPFARQYIQDAVLAARAGKIGENHLRAMVQAAVELPVEHAIPLLAGIARTASTLARTEAEIYARDKLVKEFLLGGCPPVDLLSDEPYSIFFEDRSAAPWERFGRLLGFAAQLGSDNTHPEEYARTVQALNLAFERSLAERPWPIEDVDEIAEFFLSNCDRLLFNATPQGIARFFGNPHRTQLEAILDKLASGKVIGTDDFSTIEPYTQSLTSDIEYHLAHVFFIISSLNDAEKTLQFVESRFQQLTNDSSPEEVDFLEAAIVYIHILHRLDYDESRFGRWEETILSEWPDVLMYRPGLERGERRGFQDAFDRVFEDGFGVVYPYGVLRPAARRKKNRYAEYRQALAAESSTQLPMYTYYLQEFLRTERIEEAVQVLQAIAGVLVVWPSEGLLTLRGVIGYPEPRIRRATVRILAEAFSRHPDETLHFLKTSGAAVTEDELIEIKIRQDARIGRRQVNEEEWARIASFLLAGNGSMNVFIECVRELLRAPDVRSAFRVIVQRLRFTEIAGK